MAQTQVLNEGGEGKKLDIELAVVKISAQLSWVADALETNGNEPGADVVLRGIVDQLNDLINPIARMQRELK